MSQPKSIRRQMLKGLLLPMLVLICFDSTVLYHFANKLERKAFDRELLSTATDIVQFVKKASTSQLVGLDADTRHFLLSDQNDTMFYAIRDANNKLLMGEDIVDETIDPKHLIRENKAHSSYGNVEGQEVRLVTLHEVVAIAGTPIPLKIQVAETLNKRQQLREQILISIILPQFLLLLAASGLVWLGIKRGLDPLWAVNRALAERSYRDLKPIALGDIPIEISRLVDSINAMISRLGQAIELENRFIMNAAHQLRTPLAGIRAQIELAEQASSVGEMQDRLSKVSISTERLIYLVNQLLTLAKNQPEAVQQVPFEPFDLVEFVKQVTMELVPNADLKQIDLGYEGSHPHVLILGEKTRMHDLVHNLIDNAIRYTPNGGRVTASVTVEFDQALLIVEDNGIGIPEAQRAMVFERFYRGDQTRDFGTGLGLAIVKEIIDMHDASIDISDAEEGVGTKITVSLPLYLE